MSEEKDILDLPEQNVPAPRNFIMWLSAGVAVGLVALIFRYLDWVGASMLILTSWLILSVHFILKIVFNIRNHLWLAIRDIAHLLIVTAVLSRFMPFRFSYWILGLGIVIYFITILRRFVD